MLESGSFLTNQEFNSLGFSVKTSALPDDGLIPDFSDVVAAYWVQPNSSAFQADQAGVIFQTMTATSGCLVCPPGYTSSNDGQTCYSSSTIPAVTSSVQLNTGAAVTNPLYGRDGVIFYQAGFYNSSGNSPENVYAWVGDPDNPRAGEIPIINYYCGLNGRLNRAGVWARNNPLWPGEGNYPGFLSLCASINVPTTKTYYVGLAGDNDMSFTVNGRAIVTQVNAVPEPLYANFAYWHVYPVQLNAGPNVIQLGNWNRGLTGSFACEIYDLPVNQLTSSNFLNAVENSAIFSSRDFVEGGPKANQGFCTNYSCPTSYSLDTSTFIPTCKRITYVSCSVPPTTTSTTTTTTTVNRTCEVFALNTDGVPFLYNPATNFTTYLTVSTPPYSFFDAGAFFDPLVGIRTDAAMVTTGDTTRRVYLLENVNGSTNSRAIDVFNVNVNAATIAFSSRLSLADTIVYGGICAKDSTTLIAVNSGGFGNGSVFEINVNGALPLARTFKFDIELIRPTDAVYTTNGKLIVIGRGITGNTSSYYIQQYDYVTGIKEFSKELTPPASNTKGIAGLAEYGSGIYIFWYSPATVQRIQTTSPYAQVFVTARNTNLGAASSPECTTISFTVTGSTTTTSTTIAPTTTSTTTSTTTVTPSTTTTTTSTSTSTTTVPPTTTSTTTVPPTTTSTTTSTTTVPPTTTSTTTVPPTTTSTTTSTTTVPPTTTSTTTSTTTVPPTTTSTTTSTTTVEPTTTSTTTSTTTVEPTTTSTTTSTTTVEPTTTSTTTSTTTVPPTTTSTTTSTTTAAGCQQLVLYPDNVTACAHAGVLTLFDTDNAINPTILYIAGGCGISPVAGGNLWYSQGPGADSYQVDNSGNIIATTPCP